MTAVEKLRMLADMKTPPPNTTDRTRLHYELDGALRFMADVDDSIDLPLVHDCLDAAWRSSSGIIRFGPVEFGLKRLGEAAFRKLVECGWKWNWVVSSSGEGRTEVQIVKPDSCDSQSPNDFV